MNSKERIIIKKVLALIKMPRKWDNVTANSAFHSDYFKEQVIEPLEKLSKWTEEDEADTKKDVAELQKETHGEHFVNTGGRLARIKEVVTEKWTKIFSRKKKGAEEPPEIKDEK